MMDVEGECNTDLSKEKAVNEIDDTKYEYSELMVLVVLLSFYNNIYGSVKLLTKVLYLSTVLVKPLGLP